MYVHCMSYIYYNRMWVDSWPCTVIVAAVPHIATLNLGKTGSRQLYTCVQSCSHNRIITGRSIVDFLSHPVYVYACIDPQSVRFNKHCMLHDEANKRMDVQDVTAAV